MVTFFISVFVLLMQFLWKYIDDLVGKGLEWYVILELLFYATANLIPIALPLAVLLASIMTFGNLGEKFELVAIKSAGVPLRRMLRPIFLIVLSICIGAWFFSNTIIPVANLKFGGLYYDVRNQKPAFDLQEGIFYNEIEGYSIKIGKKEKDNETVRNVMIYDHTKGRGNSSVTVAEYGTMVRSADKRFLFFTLYNGIRYEEMVENPEYYKSQPFNKMAFKKQQFAFDLSQFNLTRTALELFGNDYRFLNSSQLIYAIDSLHTREVSKKYDVPRYLDVAYHFYDTLREDSKEIMKIGVDSFYKILHTNQSQSAAHGLSIARSSKGMLDFGLKDIEDLKKLKAKHETEFWKKITLSIACFVLFLIGAPLGAIVRRGGFGLPVVVSILLFIVFYILNVTGEKMVKELVASPITGMFLSSYVLTPVGIWLTIKSTRDSALFDPDAYKRFFKKFSKKTN